MEARAGFALRIGFLAAGSLVLFGCPNPNTYTTPRTIGSGNFQHSLAAEAWGFSIPTSQANYASGETLSATFPTLPTYTLRIGIGDSWEIGARVANMTSLGTDVKWNFLKSSGIDLAIDPAFQIFQLSASDGSGTDETLRVAYLHVPILVGVNLSRTVSLVFTPGVTWGFVSGTATSTNNGTDQASATTGAIGRFGLGVDFRLTPGFALHRRSPSCAASAPTTRSSTWPGSVSISAPCPTTTTWAAVPRPSPRPRRRRPATTRHRPGPSRPPRARRRPSPRQHLASPRRHRRCDLAPPARPAPARTVRPSRGRRPPGGMARRFAVRRRFTHRASYRRERAVR